MRLSFFFSLLLGLIVGGGAPVQSFGAPADLSPELKTFLETLSPADVAETVRLLKLHFVEPDKVKDLSAEASALTNFLRNNDAAVSLSKPLRASDAAPASEMINKQTGYLRFGGLSREHLSDLDKTIAGFAGKNVNGLIIDLRASGSNEDFELAAAYAGRFASQGRSLWTLRGRDPAENRAFTNERQPAFRGVTMVLLDADTSGAAEAIAAVLKQDTKALLIGQPSAGRAVTYGDFSLTNGRKIWIADKVAMMPDGHLLFPQGITPDLPVVLSREKKLRIFALSGKRDLASFLSEPARPHFNEAALISGSNPELEQERPVQPDDDLQDPVLQRAVDVITSLAVFQKP